MIAFKWIAFTFYVPIKCRRKELQDAKKYKANQQEYDALAQIITKHPDREASEKEIKVIQSEIESLDKGTVL